MSEGGKQKTLQEKWNTKFNSVTVKKDLQGRLKNQLKKNAAGEKRSENKGGQK